jgi:hypothetical protein
LSGELIAVVHRFASSSVDDSALLTIRTKALTRESRTGRSGRPPGRFYREHPKDVQAARDVRVAVAIAARNVSLSSQAWNGEAADCTATLSYISGKRTLAVGTLSVAAGA